jgi:methionine synthase II (cobalamin-independent)
MTDIDRAFRYIQQYEPKLRGAEWLKRQKQSGEISKSQYENYYDNEIEEIVRQLKLF